MASTHIQVGHIKQGHIKQGHIKQGHIKQGHIKQARIKQARIKQARIRAGIRRLRRHCISRPRANRTLSRPLNRPEGRGLSSPPTSTIPGVAPCCLSPEASSRWSWPSA